MDCLQWINDQGQCFRIWLSFSIVLFLTINIFIIGAVLAYLVSWLHGLHQVDVLLFQGGHWFDSVRLIRKCSWKGAAKTLINQAIRHIIHSYLNPAFIVFILRTLMVSLHSILLYSNTNVKKGSSSEKLWDFCHLVQFVKKFTGLIAFYPYHSYYLSFSDIIKLISLLESWLQVHPCFCALLFDQNQISWACFPIFKYSDT